MATFTGCLKLRMSHIFSVSSPRKQRGSVGVNSRPSDLQCRRHFLHPLPLLPHSARLYNTAARVTSIYITGKCGVKDSRGELLLFVSERLQTGSPNTRKATSVFRDPQPLDLFEHRERERERETETEKKRERHLETRCLAATMQRKIWASPPREARVTPS